MIIPKQILLWCIPRLDAQNQKVNKATESTLKSWTSKLKHLFHLSLVCFPKSIQIQKSI